MDIAQQHVVLCKFSMGDIFFWEVGGCGWATGTQYCILYPIRFFTIFKTYTLKQAKVVLSNVKKAQKKRINLA